jgi:hypothetical protein
MIVVILAILLVGLHMIVQPGVYVGRGPIPAQNARSVRAIGIMFVLVGIPLTGFFLAPILKSHF